MATERTAQEFTNLFPDARGRVARRPVSEGLKVMDAIIEGGIHSTAFMSDVPTHIALSADQLEDYAFYKALHRKHDADEVMNFARVIVESGILYEGVTF